MLGVKKTTLTGKEKRRIVQFDGFGQTKDGKDLLAAEYYNCDCRDGSLRGGIGLKQCYDANGKELTVGMSISDGALHTFFTTWNRDGGQANSTKIYLVSIDGYLYLRREETGVGERKVALGNHVEHCALKMENGVVHNFFCGSKGAYGTLDGATFHNILAVECRGACICGKRYVMLTKNGEVVYTAPLAPQDKSGDTPDGMGVVYLPVRYGAPIGMKGYGDSAYVFFERGICKMNFFASAKENTLTEIPYHGGEICPYAQATTKDGILFLAREGAYYLRNDKVERVCEHLPIGPCSVEKSANVGYCEDVVIFAYYKEKGDSTQAQCVAIYTDGKDGYFTGVEGVLGGNGYVYLNGKIHRFAKDSVGVAHAKSSFFESVPLNFGRCGRKRLKSIAVYGEGRVVIGVKSGDKERTYTLNMDKGVDKTRLLDSGREFSLRFNLEAGSVVTGVEMEYVMEK